MKVSRPREKKKSAITIPINTGKEKKTRRVREKEKERKDLLPFRDRKKGGIAHYIIRQIKKAKNV